MAGNHVLLETISLTQSASSVTFDNIPQSGYTDLKIVTSTRLTGSTSYNVTKVTFNGDATTSNYRFRQLYGVGSGAPGSGNGSQPYADYSQGTLYTASTFSNGEIYIPNYLSSNYKSYSNDANTENNGSESINSLFATQWLGTNAITSITFTPDGSFSYAANSTFSLYGVAATGTTPATAPKATGGNIVANDGTYWYHAFLTSGSFIPQQALTCDYLVVAGGGAGGGGNSNGGNGGGGGGAGGLVYASANSLTALNYPVVIGAGGASVAFTIAGNNGTSSSINGTSATGGGGGGSTTSINGATGGSGGGGAAHGVSPAGSGGSNTGSQGYSGGAGRVGAPYSAGGGGGAGAAGTSGIGQLGAGGAGINTYSTWHSTTNTGVSGYIAGGGGGGTWSDSAYLTPAPGGSGGGGEGAPRAANSPGSAGIINTGSGGGGGGANGAGGQGGAGIVIIRYAMV